MSEPASTFRDSLPTVDQKGKRIWVYPRKPGGPWYRRRNVVSILLLALLFAGPFIRMQGQPMLLLNVLERRFVLFGQVFWPQDFHLFVLIFIAGIIFVALFTVVYGRLFCGWVCPQTIFMEMVFRRIEYWIEGDFNYQKRLDREPWNLEKGLKKGAKHLIFIAISAAISHTFLSYIIGVDQLLLLVNEPVDNHMGSFVAMIGFTGAFYGVFSRMREQVCTTICPYGRLQGVLLDRDSVVVAYDHVRGEQRGRLKKNEDRAVTGKGDCIDCHQCVDVCPTGIDIRNGTQLECVNCTACIDACNLIMEKTNMPRGLIRYASENEITTGRKWRLTPRARAYTAVLVILLGVIGTLFAVRSDFETVLLRTPGQLYQEIGGGRISNLYNVKLVNKTHREMPFELQLENKRGTIQWIGEQPVIPEQGIAEGSLFIQLPESELDGLKTRLKLGVYSGDRKIETVETTFIGPVK